MEAILAFLGLALLIALMIRLTKRDARSLPGTATIRPSFRAGLPKAPTREELIRHGELFWGDKPLPLGKLGEISACIGRSTYVWRDPNNHAHILCYTCACDLAAQVYTSQEGPLQTTAGTVHGLSPLDMAKMRLQSMWFYTNHFYIVTHRGGIRAEKENLPDFFPCENPTNHP